MTATFAVLLAIYAAFTMASNVRRKDPSGQSRPKLSAYLLQTPVLILACVLAAREGAFTRALVSPLYIALGLLAGHLLFGVSLLATHRHWGDTLGHFLDLRPLWRFLVENPALINRFAFVAGIEELIYRAAAQPILTGWLGLAGGLGVTAALFCVVHWHFFRNRLFDSIEFVAFALLLGLLYHWSHSLILVIVIHSVRNLEIVYLEYLLKIDELGGEDAAQKAIDRAYAVGGRTAASL